MCVLNFLGRYPHDVNGVADDIGRVFGACWGLWHPGLGPFLNSSAAQPSCLTNFVCLTCTVVPVSGLGILCE